MKLFSSSFNKDPLSKTILSGLHQSAKSLHYTETTTKHENIEILCSRIWYSHPCSTTEIVICETDQIVQIYAEIRELVDFSFMEIVETWKFFKISSLLSISVLFGEKLTIERFICVKFLDNNIKKHFIRFLSLWNDHSSIVICGVKDIAFKWHFKSNNVIKSKVWNGFYGKLTKFKYFQLFLYYQ